MPSVLAQARTGRPALDCLGVIAQPLANHLDRVRAECRRRPADRARLPIQLPWRARLADPARDRMLDLDAHLALGRQRAGERLGDILDRAGGDAVLLEAREPVCPGARPQSGLDLSSEILPCRLAQRIRRETWIRPQLRRPDGC